MQIPRAEVRPHLNSSPPQALHEEHFRWESQFQHLGKRTASAFAAFGPAGFKQRVVHRRSTTEG